MAFEESSQVISEISELTYIRRSVEPPVASLVLVNRHPLPGGLASWAGMLAPCTSPAAVTRPLDNWKFNDVHENRQNNWKSVNFVGTLPFLANVHASTHAVCNRH